MCALALPAAAPLRWGVPKNLPAILRVGGCQELADGGSKMCGVAGSDDVHLWNARRVEAAVDGHGLTSSAELQSHLASMIPHGNHSGWRQRVMRLAQRRLPTRPMLWSACIGTQHCRRQRQEAHCLSGGRHPPEKAHGSVHRSANLHQPPVDPPTPPLVQNVVPYGRRCLPCRHLRRRRLHHLASILCGPKQRCQAVFICVVDVRQSRYVRLRSSRSSTLDRPRVLLAAAGRSSRPGGTCSSSRQRELGSKIRTSGRAAKTRRLRTRSLTCLGFH
jgi:hypothetical protein